jgi:hypothetical protein
MLQALRRAAAPALRGARSIGGAPKARVDRCACFALQPRSKPSLRSKRGPHRVALP